MKFKIIVIRKFIKSAIIKKIIIIKFIDFIVITRLPISNK